MTLKLDQRSVVWFSLSAVAASLSAACMIAYVGLGMVYGAYVGLASHAADLRTLELKGSRAFWSSVLLQPIVILLMWAALSRAITDGRCSLGGRVVQVAISVAVIDLAVIGILFVLGQLGFPPVTELDRLVENVMGAGL